MTRHWTVAEANAALPQVRRIVGDLLAARERILEARPEIWPVLEKAIGNGGSRKAGDLILEFERVQRAADQIRALGIFLKDINTGLIDFLSRREGRDVFLCWQYDEPAVEHWHDIEDGFGGRQPL